MMVMEDHEEGCERNNYYFLIPAFKEAGQILNF